MSKFERKVERKASQHQQRCAQAWAGGAPQHTGSESSNDRLHIVENNEAQIEKASSQMNPETEVIVIADADDPVGSDMTKAFDKDGSFAKQAEQLRTNGEIPTVTICMPRAMAIQGFRKTNPSTSQQLQSPPPEGSFWIVAVASGGVTLLARGFGELEGANHHA